MRLRRKVTVAFFAVSCLVSILLAVSLYLFIESQLKVELKTRLRDIAQIGSHEIDRAAYDRLVAHVGAVAPADALDQMVQAARDRGAPARERAALYGADLATQLVSAQPYELSPDYLRIYEQLRYIRATEPDLIRFVYLLVPTDDANNPRFLVDADVLDPAYQGERSHYNSTYDVSEIPLLRASLTDCKGALEPDFVEDKEFHVNSVSGYFPIAGGPGHCLGVIGVDITDKDMRAALDAAGSLAIWRSIIALVIALVVSIALGTVLTRSLLALSATVTKFANKDFSARTTIASKDEIGQLGANFNDMAATIQEHSENLEHLVEVRTSELHDEKEKSERLLLNVLPAPIAQRLKTTEGVIVDRFEAVSVLFADIVGFTALSSRTSPEALVGMLDELFSAFDRLAEKHGLEKIKTIGDCYMVVSGIPEPRADHAVAIARFAMDMMAELHAYAQRRQSDLTIRCGINTGSVVAGVIGRKKFIYDLWGDTVNTASRMESHGVAGRIHVSHATYQCLEGQFDFEARGTIDIKGKGPMQTYLLVGEKAASAPAAAEG